MSISPVTDRPIDVVHRPTLADIHLFASIRAYPCVSIVLTTSPGARMSPDDRARLEALVGLVEQRLRAEGIDEEPLITQQVRDHAAALADAPTDHGLVLFATRDMVAHRHLPVTAEERVVIDPSFATRDLLRAVQATPDYLLVVLNTDSADLYRSSLGTLRRVSDDEFPIVRAQEWTRREGRSRPARRGGRAPQRSAGRQREQTLRFLRQVDAVVTARLEVEPLPVIVMAGERILSDFLSVTRMSERIIGLARGNASRLGTRRIERLVRPLLADHLADLEAAARDTLEARLPGREVLTGLSACWHAATSERPELLLVEQSYAMPARLSDDGTMLAPTAMDERELPEVIDDAVDELIELVLAKGGQVRFVPDGSLRHGERVELSVILAGRSRRSRRSHRG